MKEKQSRQTLNFINELKKLLAKVPQEYQGLYVLRGWLEWIYQWERKRGFQILSRAGQYTFSSEKIHSDGYRQKLESKYINHDGAFKNQDNIIFALKVISSHAVDVRKFIKINEFEERESMLPWGKPKKTEHIWWKEVEISTEEFFEEYINTLQYNSDRAKPVIKEVLDLLDDADITNRK